MSSAKAANNTNNWQSIDIFVFCNGQEYSPPRKYHLRADELSWWKATLNYLARSQYGSTHSVIDLFTTDGRKIEGPMQLSNGTAYVAVVPPDAFIDSGYDKYLIKASRSWEKRQTRNSSINEVIKPGQNITKTEHSECDINIKVVKTKPLEMATLESTGASDFDDQVRAVIKPQVMTNAQNKRKQAEIRRTSNNQHAAILKKVNKIPIKSSPTCRLSSIKTKDIPPKRITKVPIKADEQAMIVSDVYNNRAIEKPKTKETNSIGAELFKTEEISHEKAPTQNEETSNHKNVSPETAQIDYTIKNKDIDFVSNLFRNQNSDITSIVVEADGNPVALYEIQNNEKGETIAESKLSEPVHVEFPASTNEVLNANKVAEVQNNSKLITDIAKQSESLQNNILLINKPADDQYLTIVNKGEIVNLKLKIEITNGDNITGTRYIKKSQHQKRHFFSSIIKTEKGSQVNIENEIFLESKSLQSMPATESPHNYGIERNSKIVVVQCSCCDQYSSIPKIDTTPIYCDNKKYVILVPSLKNEEHPLRCKCDQEQYHTAEKEVQKPESIKRTSIINPLKKITSDISLETLTKSNKTTDIMEFVITRQDVAVPTRNSSNASPHQQSERNEYVVTKRVAINEKQNTKPEYLITKRDSSQISEGPQKTEFIVIRKNITKVAKDYVESFTQTNWCSVLLEARRKDDGRYSFHLPPLHVLKYYNL